MYKAIFFTLCLASANSIYAVPPKDILEKSINEFSSGCKAPEQGPRGPQGPQGPQGEQGEQGPQGEPGTPAVSSFAFFYSLTEQIVPGGSPPGSRVKNDPPGSKIGVVEFDQNDPPGGDPDHVNVNQAGFTLNTDDPNHPLRITSFGVPKSGFYQIIFTVTTSDNSQAFALADTTNATFSGESTPPDSNASVTGFTILNPGTVGTQTKEVVLNAIVNLTEGTKLSIINVSRSQSHLGSNAVDIGPGAVVASISFAFLGASQ